MRIKGSELRKIIKEELYRSRRLQEAADFSSEDEGWLDRVSSSPLGMGSSGPDVMRTQELLVAALRVIGSKALDLPSPLPDQLERLRARGAISGTQYNLQSLVNGLADEIDNGGSPDGKFGPMTALGVSILQALADNLGTTGKVDAATASALLSGVSRGGLSGSFSSQGMTSLPGLGNMGARSGKMTISRDPETLLTQLLVGQKISGGVTGLDLYDPRLADQLETLGLDTMEENVIFGKIMLTAVKGGMAVKAGDVFTADDGRRFSRISTIGGYVDLIPAGKSLVLRSPDGNYPEDGNYMVDATLTIDFSTTGFNSTISFNDISLADKL